MIPAAAVACFTALLSPLLIGQAAAADLPSNTQCDSTLDFGWASNSLGQDPCLVASFLGGTCVPTGVFIIPELPSGSVYPGPTKENVTNCVCSSVYYSVLQVCALCQGRTQDSWSLYNRNCSPVYLTVYPFPIPPGTSVPAWAFDNVVAQNQVNVSLARSQISLPESSPVPQPTSTSGTTAPSTAGAPAPHKSNNAGAIAGGVIGGVVLLTLVVGGIFFLLRQRRRPQLIDLAREDDATPTTIQVYHPSETPKLYNPSDPSTFPSSPMNSSSLYTMEPQQSLNYSYIQNEPQPNYTGAAEIN